MKRRSVRSRNQPKPNNPHAERFNEQRAKHPNGFSRVAFVMQGGGGMGAYQFGVLKSLIAGGFEPDWVAATSIGAIQAAILIGNPPEKRLENLEKFWDRVTLHSPFDIWGHNPHCADNYNKMSANSALFFGQPGFFYPRWSSPYLQIGGTPTTLSFYDTTPLRETLLELVDFERAL